MQHLRRKHRKLGRTTAHRASLLRNMAIGLFTHGKIKSTDEKCKELRMFVEKLITRAKTDSVYSRRVVASRLNNDRDIVKKIFAEIAPKYTDRPGGYTRIIKIANRHGDNATVSLIELV